MDHFYVRPWQQQWQSARSPLWKQLIYVPLRPLFNLNYRRYLSEAFLSEIMPTLVIGERGLPLEWRRRWAVKSLAKNISQCVVLVQGTGNGWDVASWAAYRPKRIIGVDYFDFRDSWNDVKEFFSQNFGVNVQFMASDLSHIHGVEDGSIDLCASDAVYEHCKDLKGVLRETWRVLAADGRLCAGYGPLSYCAGGDHFSGRGGLRYCFSHIEMSTTEYAGYVASHKLAEEDAQSGARYIELDLFSRLTAKQYIRCLQESGFERDSFGVIISSVALKLRSSHEGIFETFKVRYSITSDDLVINSNFFLAHKNRMYR